MGMSEQEKYYKRKNDQAKRQDQDRKKAEKAQERADRESKRPASGVDKWGAS